jgi:hypothetical protein
MTNEDITNAIYFLRRVVAYGKDLEALIKTVEALEAELSRRSTTHE